MVSRDTYWSVSTHKNLTPTSLTNMLAALFFAGVGPAGCAAAMPYTTIGSNTTTAILVSSSATQTSLVVLAEGELPYGNDIGKPCWLLAHKGRCLCTQVTGTSTAWMIFPQSAVVSTTTSNGYTIESIDACPYTAVPTVIYSTSLLPVTYTTTTESAPTPTPTTEAAGPMDTVLIAPAGAIIAPVAPVPTVHRGPCMAKEGRNQECAKEI